MNSDAARPVARCASPDDWHGVFHAGLYEGGAGPGDVAQRVEHGRIGV